MDAPSEYLSVIHSLRQEIDSLTDEQTTALLVATYAGMTPEQAKQCDGRRLKLVELIDELEQLESAA